MQGAVSASAQGVNPTCRVAAEKAQKALAIPGSDYGLHDGALQGTTPQLSARPPLYIMIA